MSKDPEKTTYVFVDGDRHEAKAVRDSEDSSTAALSG
jgi:hypothetical protein